MSETFKTTPPPEPGAFRSEKPERDDPARLGDLFGSWEETRRFRSLLVKSSLLLMVCAALVALAYFFVDKPVAYFVQEHHLDQYRLLKWLTYTPIFFEALAPFAMVAIVLLLAWRPLSRWQWTILAFSVNLMITLIFKDHLKYVFGRYWPSTWIDNNPSLIQDGAYGFHPFHEGVIYGSFPSGHTARILAVVSVLWIAYPQGRWLWFLLAASVVVGLLGMNYHFVGDVIGGFAVGTVTGMYTAHFFKLDRPEFS